MSGRPAKIGKRVVVTGLAGSGKSTFSKRLASTTGLPLIHLDLAYWQPGWLAPSDAEWKQQQQEVLAGEAWIADGNYTETLAMRLERADTVVVLDTPWLVCVGRALVRGVRASDREMPEGCADSAWRRFRDECGVARRSWQKRRTEPQREREIIAQHGHHANVHVLRSRTAVDEFFDALTS